MPMRSFHGVNPPAGTRSAFDVADYPMADAAHKAWIGDSGKHVPAKLRNTIKSYWPDSPDDSARDLLGKALELLGRSMCFLNEPKFLDDWGTNWHDDLCRRYSILDSRRHKASRDDPYVPPKILQMETDAATALLGSEAHERLQRLLRARNRWA